MLPKINIKTAAIWFWSVVGFFAVLWVILPTLLHPAYDLDAIELQLIGKEWVLATRKHPMLPAWILEILNIITYRSFAAPFIASQLCMVLTLWSVWQLGRKVLSEKLALIGTFVMLPYWFFNVEAIFNQNIILLACWTLSILLFYCAFQSNQMRHWIGAGIILGLGFHAKYPMIFLAVAMLFYSLSIPRLRKLWKGIGPWLCIGIAFIIFLPHLIWLYQDHFSTLTYMESRQRVRANFINHFYFPLRFAFCEMGYGILPIVSLVPILGWRWKLRQPESIVDQEAVSYLRSCLAVPFGIHLLISGIMAISMTAAYGAALWAYLGLYLLLQFQRNDTQNVFSKTLKTVILLEGILIIVFVVQAVFSPYLTASPRRFHFPMRELGTECNRLWDSRYPVPCPYIGGEWFIAGNAAYTMKECPSVIFYWNTIQNVDAKPTGTWAEDSDMDKKGGLVLWNRSREDMPKWLHVRYPRAEVLPETLVLPYKTGATIPPLQIGVAVIPPPEHQ